MFQLGVRRRENLSPSRVVENEFEHINKPITDGVGQTNSKWKILTFLGMFWFALHWLKMKLGK